MKTSKIQNIGAFIIIGCLILMMLYTAISTVIAIKNKIIDKESEVNFAKIYPFQDEKNLEKGNILTKYKNIINKIEEKIEECTSKKLIGYEKFIESSYNYNNLIKYKLISNSSENARIEIENGYLSRIVQKVDVKSNVSKIIEFNEYLREKNIDMLYIQAPYKISEDQKISNIYKDYSNENMDNFLKGIKGKIEYLDLRKNIKDNNLNHLELFYKTDHHWLPRTGLWATNEISNYLNKKFQLNLEENNINPNNFDSIVYKDLYLGSDGRYVSLVNAKPEDFEVIIPKYETKLTVKIPDKGIDKTGSYKETLIDKEKLKCNYYKISSYAAYAHGDRPLIEIHNELIDNNKKILLIRDSFSEVVLPFLALENECISSIDLRHFNGSLKNYINTYKPDIVIVMYNGNIIIDDKADQPESKMWIFE